MPYGDATGALLLVACVALAYWPGVNAFWGRDDYGMLAFVRELGNPWPLFVQDHHAVPATLFRPLGYFSYWLGVQVFGIDYRLHALCELALHAANALALFLLLRRAQCATIPATLGAALFALHPGALGTALWFAARFDLLATLFVLLALHAALTYRRTARPMALVGAAVCALLAMSSKEIGLVAVAASTLVWLEWAWSEPTQRRRAFAAIAVALGCAAAFLVWRAAVLGTFTSRFTGDVDIRAAAWLGLGNWLRQWPGYIAFWTPSGTVTHAFVLAAAVLLAAAILAAAPRLGARRNVLAACGLCLILAPALVQAPAEASALPVTAAVSAVERAMQSRLYYLGLAGLGMVLASLLDACVRRRGARTAAFAAAAIVAAFALQAHGVARQFKHRTVEISSIARAASAAVGKLDLPSRNCHIAFVDVQPPPEWNQYVAMDAVVKALAPDISRVEHCWIHANYFTGTNLMAAPAEAADAAPFVPRVTAGNAVPWRRIGDVVLAHARAPRDLSADELVGIRLLRYQEGAFVPMDASELGGARLHLE